MGVGDNSTSIGKRNFHPTASNLRCMSVSSITALFPTYCYVLVL